MNKVKVYQEKDSGWYIAYEVGNKTNRASGMSTELAIQNLMAKQAPSPKKIKADLETYLEEIVADINAIDVYWENSAVTEEERIKNEAMWKVLNTIALRLEKILKGEN